jgi:hypothetical protein
VVVDLRRQRLDLLDAEDVVAELGRESGQPDPVRRVDRQPPFGDGLVEDQAQRPVHLARRHRGVSGPSR